MREEWHEKKREWKERNRWWLVMVAPPAGLLVVALIGMLVKYLWNEMLAPIFGIHTIGFWQALGLLLLSRILFGSWGPGGDRHRHYHGRGRCGCGPRGGLSDEERERMRQHWAERAPFSPEEVEQFRRMRAERGFAGPGAPPWAPQPPAAPEQK